MVMSRCRQYNSLFKTVSFGTTSVIWTTRKDEGATKRPEEEMLDSQRTTEKVIEVIRS